jgi:TolB-like protein/Flp pilus assembly protein TadD
MPSIIEGFNYDIFISYRQKDNKHDGWVTEFVNQLRGELEVTFKEDISIYFDENPHDGLLETHSVDKSLESKLKCLILIPIISQTYCDPKSYAWQHEFCAFNKLAKDDQFGRDIRLASGNVASRILPVKIHDLDPEDKALLENELGGVLRGIEFIYKEAGVNRPLKPNDDVKENLNRTQYLNQVNKVANAVKEIITAFKKQSQPPEEGSRQGFNLKSVPQKNQKTKIIAGSLILLAFIVIGYFVVPKLIEHSTPLEKTIAVLPFRNLSNDTTQIFFCDGFMEELINNLKEVKSFTVRSRTSSDQYRGTKKSITIIGNELNVNYLVEGSVGREGSNLKIWVQLIDSKVDKHLWSKDYLREFTTQQIFSLQTEISQAIASELKAVLTPKEIEKIEKKPTENLEAFNYYIQGNYYQWKSYSLEDLTAAIALYQKALEIDPKFALAYCKLATCLLTQFWVHPDNSEGLLQKSKQAIDKAIEIDADLSEAHFALGIYYYFGHLKYAEALEQFEIVLKNQPNNSEAIYYIASVNRRAGNWELSKVNFVKAFELDPRSSRIAYNTGHTFDLLRNYTKAEEYYKMAVILQPAWSGPIIYLSDMYLRWKGDINKAKEILANAARNNKSVSDSISPGAYIWIDIYNRNYEEALRHLSYCKSEILSQGEFTFRPKYLYYAYVYSLMDNHILEHTYYDSARIFLEKKIIDRPDDQRLYSSLGIAYAGLGLEKKAINTGKKAIELLPINKDAWRGVNSVEDMALSYVLLGKYREALEQVDYLLSIPGFFSTKILEMNPLWAPLKNQPEFKNILEKYTFN